MSLLKIVNEIIELAETGNFWRRTDVSWKSFSFGGNSINFVNENLIKYLDALSRAFDSDEEIKRTYTLKKYESLLLEHFIECLSKKCLAKNEDVSSFVTKLKAESIKTFSVFRDIHGIVLNSPKIPLLLGGYTIYDFASQKDFFDSKIDSKTDSFPQIEFNDDTEYLIEWKAEARHFEKALEIADEHFERFELILRYVLGSATNRFEVGVLNYQGLRHRKAYILSDMGQVSRSSTLHGPIEDPIPLDDPYLVNEDNGYHTVWGFTTKKNLNDFQKRIMLAVEWIGQSMADPSPPSAFIKAAIALEIIFTYQDDIITPGIIHQISESIALILGSSVDERLKMESRVKKLYRLRSKIVHFGNKDISQADYKALLEIARSVIIKILTSDKLNSVESVQNLYSILKQIKYSGDAISQSAGL